ncbi:3D-(3,5/4)-trihydroxycyclohexane-1,2-dione acylhydrolase (decyclizing) [Baekduia soli]|uniref:3D-(3,5/4)-trihydroxycyclohexane-1,2-dione acylhydrolase (Decyclizing) n=1 Tax=Baekduia soli TaxID=496014 RepID=A0A5B8UCP4_9ACTN|nr:3D-(3,5/4)-trihydroxycyclohexane-1,2-dione acylhydrolase (decyclizing) [Baekduia soli]QEC50441.1 3D-(3,5/4)-trihydroxycyclohexane-1,2-dione acylhydrolase (decyclizing) [Baekduia soli]
MKTIRLTTAQAMVRYLAVQHSERDGRVARLVPAVAGIFGHGNVAGMGQALQAAGAELPFVQARNEQSMVHMAVGYAKAMRRTATLACTSSIGPGATNMVTGAALATVNRLPVLLLPSDTYATRRQGTVLQQLEHPSAGDVSVNDCFRPVSRHFDRVTRPEALLTALPEAMRVLTSPVDAGAVTLALPQDVQSEAYDFPIALFEPRTWRIARPPAEPEALARAGAALAAARRPIIIAGGGVHYSEAQGTLASLAERLGIPVVETFAGKGAVEEDAWWALGGLGLEGNPAANATAAEADLVIAVGTRLTDFATGSHSLFQDPDVTVVAINVDGRDAHKLGALPVIGDARDTLAALEAAAVAAGAAPQEGRREAVQPRRTEWTARRSAALAGDGAEAMTQGRLIGILQEHACPGDTIVAAAGGPPGDLLKVWDATGARHCHLEFGFSCMGYEIPAALGVRLAQPDGEVIAFVGDGTYLMNPTELVTAAQEGMAITVVVSENHGFQCIRRLQVARAGQEFGNEFRARARNGDGPLQGAGLEGEYIALDLAATARGFGAQAYQARTAAEVAAALDAARAARGPVVIVVETVPHHDLPPGGVWWDVAPAEVSDDPGVRERRAAYEDDRARLQRFHG